MGYGKCGHLRERTLATLHSYSEVVQIEREFGNGNSNEGKYVAVDQRRGAVPR